MTNSKETVSRKKRSNYIIAALLAFLLALSLTLTGLPAAYAYDGAGTGTPAGTVVSQEPLPSETPAVSEEPLPSETPAASEEPLPSETPIASEEPQTAETGILTTEYNGLECVDGEILVKFKDTVTDTKIVSALDAVDSSVQQELPIDNLVVTDVPAGETVGSFIETMKAQPSVEFAQPNYIYHADTTTVNDPYTIYQWHLETIGAMDAWDVTAGSPNVKVAIIDTGMDLDHPDLAGKVYAQYDYVHGDRTAQDDNGHGTHVAGIIAATANNGKGVAGVAPGVKLIIVKVLNSRGVGSTENCIKGIYYAVRNGADVINMSYGGYGVDELQEEAVNYAVSKGVVCVAAAGNGDEEGTPKDEYSSPSDYEACISVMATDMYDIRASYSDFGPRKDISAPGVNIMSTYNPSVSAGDYYGYMQGTSMASPVVAGAAALLLSVNPDLTVDQVKDLLYSTAVDLGDAGRDDYYGYGRVNADAAVDKAKAGTPVISSIVSTNYNSVDLSWNAMENAAGYEVWRSTYATSGYTKIVPQTEGTLYTDTSFTDTGLNSGTTYYYKVKVNYESGTDIIPGYFSLYSYVRPVPLAPVSITAQRTAYSTIKTEWSAVDGATGYMVFRSVYPDRSFTKAATTSGTYAYISGLTTGTTYYFKVCAYRSSTSIYGAFSPLSDPATPTLNEMTGVTAVTYYPTAIRISWAAVPGRTRYQVFRSSTLEGPYSYIGSTRYTYFKSKGLAVDKQYYYQVRAYRTIGTRRVYNAKCTPVEDTTEVFKVANPKAVMYSVTSNKISWSRVTGASGYEILRSEPESGEYLHVGYTSRTYYYNKYLVPNKMYYYKVRAYRYVGTVKHFGLESDMASATPVFNNVTNVNAYMYAVTSNKITWNAVSGRTGYEVFWSETADGEYTQLTDPNKIYPYTYIYHQNLAGNGKLYYYKVKAYVIVNGIRQYSTMSDAATAYNVVTGINGAMYSVNSNKITWNPVSGRTGYEVFWSETKDGEYTKLTPDTAAYTNTYIYHTNLEKDKTYFYKVRAYVGTGSSRIVSSDSVAVSVVNMLAGANAYSYSYSSNKITWSPVASRTYYELYRCDADGNNLTEQPLKVTGYTYYIDTGLTTGQTYYYKVRAYQTIGDAPVYCNYSKVVPAVPTLKGVSGAHAARYSNTKIKLTWYSAAGATGYEIQRWNGVEYVTIKNTTSRYYYDSGLTHGKRYYYRIRACRTIGENTYYGDWSKRVYATT